MKTARQSTDWLAIASLDALGREVRVWESGLLDWIGAPASLECQSRDAPKSVRFLTTPPLRSHPEPSCGQSADRLKRLRIRPQGPPSANWTHIDTNATCAIVGLSPSSANQSAGLLRPGDYLRSQPESGSPHAQIDDRAWHIGIPLLVGTHRVSMGKTEDLSNSLSIGQIFCVHNRGHSNQDYTC